MVARSCIRTQSEVLPSPKQERKLIWSSVQRTTVFLGFFWASMLVLMVAKSCIRTQSKVLPSPKQERKLTWSFVQRTAVFLGLFLGFHARMPGASLLIMITFHVRPEPNQTHLLPEPDTLQILTINPQNPEFQTQKP